MRVSKKSWNFPEIPGFFRDPHFAPILMGVVRNGVK